MASFLDIAPALGHGIVSAQGMPGGYDAIDDRRFWTVGRQEGATTPGAWKVHQRAAGANLQLEVDAQLGHFLVQGDDVLFQGLYLVPALATKATLDLANAPDATNPRVDSVVLEAIDDEHVHTGITRARLKVISGTPTAGANVADSPAYIASRPALPNSTARLADFIVGAAAGSITDANIRDRRAWANGAFYAHEGDTSNIDVSSAANAWIDLDATNMKPRLETSGGVLVVRFDAYVEATATGSANQVMFRVTVDGVEKGVRLFDINDSNHRKGCSLEWKVTGIAAGSHVVAMQVGRTGAQSTPRIFGLSGRHRYFSVEERPALASASNG